MRSLSVLILKDDQTVISMKPFDDWIVMGVVMGARREVRMPTRRARARMVGMVRMTMLLLPNNENER